MHKYNKESRKAGNKVGSCRNTTKKAEKLEIKLAVAEIKQQKTKSWKQSFRNTTKETEKLDIKLAVAEIQQTTQESWK